MNNEKKCRQKPKITRAITIGKSQDANNKEKWDNKGHSHPQVIIRISIIPANEKERAYGQYL